MELSIRISGIPLRQATYLDPTGPKILKGRRHHSLRMYSGHRRVKNEAPWASGRYHNMYLKRARKRSKRRKQEFCFNLAILPPFVAYEGSLLRREHFSRKRQTPPRRAGKSGHRHSRGALKQVVTLVRQRLRKALLSLLVGYSSFRGPSCILSLKFKSFARFNLKETSFAC